MVATFTRHSEFGWACRMTPNARGPTNHMLCSLLSKVCQAMSNFLSVSIPTAPKSQALCLFNPFIFFFVYTLPFHLSFSSFSHSFHLPNALAFFTYHYAVSHTLESLVILFSLTACFIFLLLSHFLIFINPHFQHRWCSGSHFLTP